MGGAGDWICGVIHRGIRSGGLGFGVGTEARLRAVCDVPDHCRHRSAGVGVWIFEVDMMLTRAHHGVGMTKGIKQPTPSAALADLVRSLDWLARRTMATN